MQPKIVISLTTFPKRMDTIHLVIKSLLAMRPCPDKIVLYLSEPEFPDKKLPLNLTEMQSGIFEIRFTKHNYKSFNKLIHALRDFPESIIITVDDDIIYPSHMLRRLLAAHKKYPTDICANRIRELNISDNTIQPYTTWHLSERRKLFGHRPHRGYTNVQMGVGGVLYPAHSLHPDVLDTKKFTKLCEHQDDIWFWAMTILNNRKIVPTYFGCKLSGIESAKQYGLYKNINSTSTSPNNIAIENIISEYPDIKNKINIK